VLIRVRAFGLNHSEVVTRKGGSGNMVIFPRVLGIECVGEVVEAPGSSLAPGQRVMAMSGGMGREYDGGYAEYALIPLASVVPVDSTLGWAEYGAVPLTYGTAWGTLAALDLDAGQSVLVHGGSSSVGLDIISLAKSRGLVVLATTRNASKAPSLERAGADHVLAVDGDVTPLVRELFPAGIDGLCELIGPIAMAEAFGALKKNGRACITGFLEGYGTLTPEGRPDLSGAFASAKEAGIDLRFFGSNVITHEDFRPNYDQIVRGIADGSLRANVDRVFQLDEIADAHRYMDQNRAVGKVVVLTPQP
jgi:NADPH:quinone reductase-like Zn-dependent oxidoreductase